MATTKKKTTEVPASRVAASSRSERRVEVSPSERKPSYDEISRRAFEIWDSTGRAPGHDVENWLRAETELRGGAEA